MSSINTEEEDLLPAGRKSPPPPNPYYEPPKTAGPFISFPLSGGNRFELRLIAPVSKKDFERLKSLIELSEDSLVEE